MKTVIKNMTILLLFFIGLVSCNKDKKEAFQIENEAINTEKHWPNDAQLVISVSMQFETGGQPEGAESPFSGNPLPKGVSVLTGTKRD